MSQLKKRLRVVWDNLPPKRYTPRSLDGGTGWGVFDHKQGRFLKDREVLELDSDALATETTMAN